MHISKDSPESTVVRTKCEACGLEGYVFPDQLPRGEELRVRDWWYSKCCNGRQRNEKRSHVLYFVDPEKACRLQAIRKRETTINPADAIANF